MRKKHLLPEAKKEETNEIQDTANGSGRVITTIITLNIPNTFCSMYKLYSIFSRGFESYTPPYIDYLLFG